MAVIPLCNRLMCKMNAGGEAVSSARAVVKCLAALAVTNLHHRTMSHDSMASTAGCHLDTYIQQHKEALVVEVVCVFISAVGLVFS
jgi:hypothetical protein